MDREWTDKRTDDLVDRVGRFEGDVKERFDKVDARFDKVDGKMDRMNRTLLAGLVAIVVAVAAKAVGV